MESRGQEEWEIPKNDSLAFMRMKYYTSLKLQMDKREIEPLVRRKLAREQSLLNEQEGEIETIHTIDESRIKSEIPVSKPSTGMIGSIFPLTNTIIGAGTLTLPYTFAVTGIGLGASLVVLVAILCAFSAHLLIISSEFSDGISYKDLAVASFGRWGARIVEGGLILLTFGSMAAYLVVVGDLLPSVLALFVKHREWWMDGRFLVAMLVVAVILPLSLIKKISSLRYTSILSLAAICYLVTIVIVKSIVAITTGAVQFPGTTPEDKIVYVDANLKMLVAMPILSMAFTFHMNIAPVYTELANATPSKMQNVCNISIGISSTVYLIAATFGYLNFRQLTSSNILTNFPHGDIPVVIGNVALIIVVCFTFPLINYPCRGNILTLFFRGSDSLILHVIITVACVAGAYGVSIMGLNLGFIFGLVGSTVGILLVFILPSAYYLKLCPFPIIKTPKKFLALLLFLLGIFLSIICTWTVIYFRNSK